MSAKNHGKPREGWEAAARIARLEEAAHKASNYQIAAGRIEILAGWLAGLDVGHGDQRTVRNDVDAFAGAIAALAKLAQLENEI